MPSSTPSTHSQKAKQPMRKKKLNPSALKLLPQVPTKASTLSNADYVVTTGLSRRQVQRAFDDLEAAGAVVRTYGRHDGTSGSSRSSRRVWSDEKVQEVLDANN